MASIEEANVVPGQLVGHGDSVVLQGDFLLEENVLVANALRVKTDHPEDLH